MASGRYKDLRVSVFSQAWTANEAKRPPHSRSLVEAWQWESVQTDLVPYVTVWILKTVRLVVCADRYPHTYSVHVRHARPHGYTDSYQCMHAFLQVEALNPPERLICCCKKFLYTFSSVVRTSIHHLYRRRFGSAAEYTGMFIIMKTKYVSKYYDYLSRMITISLLLNRVLPHPDVTTYDTNYICPQNSPDHCEKEPFY